MTPWPLHENTHLKYNKSYNYEMIHMKVFMDKFRRSVSKKQCEKRWRYVKWFLLSNWFFPFKQETLILEIKSVAAFSITKAGSIL